MTDSFRPVSLEFNTSLSKEIRKEQGIFFTPNAIRTRLFEVVTPHMPNPVNILEPCFGSGEFVHDALTRYPTAAIYGVEKNKTLADKVIANLETQSNVELRNMDFLDLPSWFQVDLIIGNPPYFVTEAKNTACMVGRGNIFVQFIYKCLTQHLTPGGILAFVLPTSFYNCSYYQPCRDYVIKHTTVIHIQNLDGGFYDTAQDTMLMVLRNTPPQTQQYSFTLHGHRYLSPYYKELTEFTQNTTTIASLGLTAKTGDVVWNQEKDELHDTQGTVVIYMSNIVNNTLVLDNFPERNPPSEKKQRIKTYKRPPVRGPAILVARGYGNAHYKLSYVFVPESMGSFYGENHVNVITASSPASQANLQRVLQSFADERTSRFLAMFVGNCALSKTELESVLPIF